MDNAQHGVIVSSPLNECSTDDVEDAAKQANAHDFISQFPDGYDTLVGERGVR